MIEHPERPILGVGHTAGELHQPAEDRLEIQATADCYARIEEQLEPRSISDTSIHPAIVRLDTENPRRDSVATPIRRRQTAPKVT